jgi:hypothetical protein
VDGKHGEGTAQAPWTKISPCQSGVAGWNSALRFNCGCSPLTVSRPPRRKPEPVDGVEVRYVGEGVARSN